MSIFNWRDTSDTRQLYEDAERRAALERRERDRQERQRADEYHRRLQKRIDDRLREIAMKRAEREAAKLEQEHDRQDRILARIEEKYPDRPYGRRGAGHGDPVAQWKEAVGEALRACGGNRQRAVCLANERNPGLRQAVIAAANAAR